jgi:membrane-associated protease RseP (regulator of RpoE activity)
MTTPTSTHDPSATRPGGPSNVPGAAPAPAPAHVIAEPEVVRTDPAPLRWWHAWRRSTTAEGRRSESHPLRAVAFVVGVVALAWWLPGAAVFLGMLSVLVVVHEGGHYLVARRAGMRPTEFFVGFGPTVWARTTSSGLRWGLKVLPAGGYVKIPGMGPRDQVEASLEPYTYRAASRPRRLAVILAGVAVNLALAVVLFAAQVMLDTPAGPIEALGEGASMTAEVLGATLEGLGGLVTGVGDYVGSVAAGDVPEHRMMSPIGGAQLTDGILGQDPTKLLLLTGVFSASLALLNLLPLLPLDGGHAALVVAEGALARIRRRPRLRLDPNRFTPVAVAVLVALLALSATSAYLDVLHPLSLS